MEKEHLEINQEPEPQEEVEVEDSNEEEVLRGLMARGA